MAFAPIPEYEGKSPYVFLSYAQQDEKIAYAIAVKMYNEGFRIWSSAACGNPSTVRIAERLGNAAVVMVFLSKSFLKSASYKEFESRAVMNSPKPKIVILLDDTPMGTDWNAVDFPAGIRYNPDIPEGMWLRINSSDALEKCRGAWPKRPMPEPFDEKPKADLASVDEEELTDELSSLNNVMSSFGAGLDDEEISHITLFRKDYGREESFKWPEASEPTQEQEYYSIENLMGNAPMIISPEKKQYDSMIGLIESFMEKSSRVREEEKERQRHQEEADRFRSKAPVSPNTYSDYRAVPKNEFDSVDLTRDTSSAPVVITQSSAPVPVTLDYGDESDVAAYSMTRSAERAERVSELIYTPPAPEPILNEVESNERGESNKKPQEKTPAPRDEKKDARPADASDLVFEKVVDDRKFIKSTDDNMDGAKLTYHLGSLFDGFDESDFAQEEETPPEKPAPPKPEPEPEKKPEKKPEKTEAPVMAFPPVKRPDDDEPLPSLRFEKPTLPAPPEKKPLPTPPEPPRRKRVLSKPRRRYIVSVRRGVRHIEYDEEMYEVNGRWIPGNIYHRLMPNAKYTAIRRISHKTVTEPEVQPVPTVPTVRRDLPPDSDSLLRSAASTFLTGARRNASGGESISEDVRTSLRARHEMRRNEGIRQFEEALAASQPPHPEPSGQKKAPEGAEGDNAPARKHKFSHEGGIKKALFADMESPVNTDVEESHRQHGARAEAVAEAAEAAASEDSGGKKSKKKDSKKDEKAAKKAAKKAAEKAAEKKAESKKNEKKSDKKEDKKEDKKDDKKDDKKGKKQPVEDAPVKAQPALASAFPMSAFPDSDDDSLIEMPRKNLPNLQYDPAAYSTMNLSEILFGEKKGDKGDKGEKDKKKKKK